MHKHIPFFHSFFSLKHIAFVLVVTIMVLVVGGIGYVLGWYQMQQQKNHLEIENRLLRKQLATMVVPKPTKEECFQETALIRHQMAEIRRLNAILDKLLAQVKPHIVPLPSKPTPVVSHPKPPVVSSHPNPVGQKGGKLVIIIDDVSTARDISAIRSTGLPLVMSFLPPTAGHKDSALLAQNIAGAMIHLPLEAVDYKGEETITLRTTDSQATIDAQIQKIKQLYPNAHYVNNHTGSKFTADKPAMERLMMALSANGLRFVDSRTIGTSKAKEVEESLRIPYLGRDVFLDHDAGVAAIKRQIVQAVSLAQRKGTAIAIGHPHPDTIQALKESKGVLNQVTLVGIDKI
ncbi:MAG: divergent polysaccharide deacetylase family protein [Sulfuricurvum sp.]